MAFGDSVFDRLDEWTKGEVKPGELGRILAILLTVIVICIAIVAVARIVVSLAIPTLVIVALLLAYHIITPSEMQDGVRDLPDILKACTNYISGMFCKLKTN